MTKLPRRWIAALAVVTIALLAVAAALQVAARRLHSGIEAALGPRASVDAVSLGLTGVELHGLRVRAVPGRWPAADELRADRVGVVPALSSLWRSGWHLASVTVEGASLSLLRTRDGKLRVLPSLTEGGREDRAAAGSAGTSSTVRIGELRLRDATVDFHDASVAGTRGMPHRIRLEALDATIGSLALPALDGRTAVSLRATLKGPQRNGTLSLQGHLTPATRDADLALEVKGLDLVILQPYLLRGTDAAVRRGALDLSLDAHVEHLHVNAPGRLTLTDLELAGGTGPASTFAGVPRNAVLAAMSRNGRVELAFKLDGRIDDPKFSLNELFAARFAVGLAEKLGVSVGGAVEGLGSVIKGLFGR